MRALATVLCLVLPWAVTAGEAPAADVLPDIGLTRLDGAGSNLMEAQAGKAVVLNVWATWCAPCRAELPSLQRLSDTLDPGRFAVVGLSVDEDHDFVREYLRDIGITFANYLAADHGAAAGRLGVESFPQTLLVRPDGTLAQRVVGRHDWAAPAQRAAVRALLIEP